MFENDNKSLIYWKRRRSSTMIMLTNMMVLDYWSERVHSLTFTINKVGFDTVFSLFFIRCCCCCCLFHLLFRPFTLSSFEEVLLKSTSNNVHSQQASETCLSVCLCNSGITTNASSNEETETNVYLQHMQHIDNTVANAVE